MAYVETDYEFIDEWAERWCSLVHLIYETICTDKPAAVLLQPGMSEESLYQSLRSWLIEKETRFLPLWKQYYQSLDWTLDASQDILQQIGDGDKCLENPFIAFYIVESLDSLLHCISGSNTRYPTEEQAWDVAMDLLRLDLLALSFANNYTMRDAEENIF